MRSILIYTFTMLSTTDPKEASMTSSVFILGGSLALILAAVWWVFRA
jgi:hypothetical protein